MTSPLDLELHGTDEPDELPPPRRSKGPWIVAAVLVVAAAVAAYIVFSRRLVDRAGEPGADTTQTAQAPTQPLGGAADPIAVPPLDESDPLVRELVSKLSSHPRVAAWLATDGLIRNFTVVVTSIAEGRTPAAHVPALRPTGGVRILEQDDDIYLDPRSYARYDQLAQAVASVDAAGAARLYATLKPRIEDAYRELGLRDASFDVVLERAIVRLLETPIGEQTLRVEPRGIGYGFADPKLEALTGAQKQLLRMGPANARVVQGKLREIALALGIPAERLPPAG
jgi:hypothetical protein